MLASTNHLEHPILGLLIVAAIFSNLSSIYFTIYKLKVHKHIKRILLWGTVQNCIGAVVLLVGYLLMLWGQQAHTFVACAMYSIPLQHGLNGGYVMTSTIAVIR